MSLISCYTDTETTGLNPSKGDRIVEVCCILTVDFEIVDTFHTLVNPERPVGFSATIHGHTDDKLRNAPVFIRKFKPKVGNWYFKDEVELNPELFISP